MKTHAYVRDVGFDEVSLRQFVDELRVAHPEDDPIRQALLEFPTLYIVRDAVGGDYEVYVGETTDISARTMQHLRSDARSRGDWDALAKSSSSRMFVIGHTLANKSLTLDLENRLMQYLASVDCVKKVHNRRTNSQNQYYTREHLDEAFSEIWRQLRHHDAQLFPLERVIRDSALFRASPFHTLSQEQFAAKADIHTAIIDALGIGQRGQLVLVQGEAGAGKTVLLSSLLYDLFQGISTDGSTDAYRQLNTVMLVNHDEQLVVYDQLATKLGLQHKGEQRVMKPTRFINATSTTDPVDVVLVDEAHLLWTQGKQSYRGVNMVMDLLERARVVVAVFDPRQIIGANAYWEPDQLHWLRSRARISISLHNQMRMAASEATLGWIHRLLADGEITPLPVDANYDLRVFADPGSLHAAIRAKAADTEHGLSRMLATYDWQYHGQSKPEGGATWDVVIGDYHSPWNRQLPRAAAGKKSGLASDLAWAEQPQTIDEIGSHFTIQGFDLNYAGVVIGPSVGFQDGHLTFHKEKSQNKQVRNRRRLSDGTMKDVADDLLRNELNILLTRGVHGLYLFAADPALQAALMRAQEARDG